MIASFRSKALRRFWEEDDPAGVNAQWRKRVGIVLSALDAARRPAELDLPGFRFHPLKGDKAGRFAVNVSPNWRVTFGWAGEDAVDVDLEDYHG
jgi:proteic killer suppression protein